MLIKTILVRKATNKDDILDATEALKRQFKSQPREVEIAKVIELTYEDFKEFKSDLLRDRLFIQEHTDLCKWTEELITALLVKAEGSKDEDGIIVETEGANYARYTGIPITEEVKE